MVPKRPGWGIGNSMWMEKVTKDSETKVLKILEVAQILGAELSGGSSCLSANLILLCPAPGIEAMQSYSDGMALQAIWLHKQFCNEEEDLREVPLIGLWLNNQNQTPDPGALQHRTKWIFKLSPF